MKRIILILVGAGLSAGCAHTYRLERSRIRDLPWSVRSEMPRDSTVLHIIETDGTGHLVRSAAVGSDTLYFAHHLASFPAPQLEVEPLSENCWGRYADGPRGTIPMKDIAVIRFRSRRKGFGKMYVAGVLVGSCSAFETGWETALLIAPVTGVITAAFIPAKSLVEIRFRERMAVSPPVHRR